MDTVGPIEKNIVARYRNAQKNPEINCFYRMSGPMQNNDIPGNRFSKKVVSRSKLFVYMSLHHQMST